MGAIGIRTMINLTALLAVNNVKTNNENKNKNSNSNCSKPKLFSLWYLI
jgi:hypothetical protein